MVKHFAKLTALQEHKDYVLRKQLEMMHKLQRKVPEWEIIRELITAYKKQEGESK